MDQTMRIKYGWLGRLGSSASVFLILASLYISSANGQWTPTNNDISNTNTGNVGIGTSSPGTKLDIRAGAPPRGANSDVLIGSGGDLPQLEFYGTSNSSAIQHNAGGLTFFTNGPTWRSVLHLGHNGNVGVGTQEPGALFHVNNSTSPGGLLVSGQGSGVMSLKDLGGPTDAKLFQWRSEGGLFRMTSVNDAWSGVVQGNILVANAAGYVGIGMTPSAYRLDVSGEINATGIRINGIPVGGQWTGSTNLYYNAGNVGIGTGAPNAKLDIGNSAWSLGGSAASTTFRTSAGILSSTAANDLTLGSLGFGAGPSTNSVSLGVHAYRLSAGTDWTTTALGLGMDVDNTPRVNGSSLWFHANGNVGIGTASPGNKLSVNGSAVFGGAAGSSGEPIEVQGGSSGVAFKDRNGTSPRWVLYPTGGVFHLYNDALGNALSVSAAGNVGIGTSPSSSKLEVSGNLNASGTITGGSIVAKYQDVAEWVDSPQELTAGTVVVLDSSKSNQVIASNQSYDSRVAGVISLRPGLTLGERGEGRVLVATTGRVKVRVDATAGAIQIGDLLVTSDKEGVAMKSMPVEIGGVRIHRPGTLIGKALEPLTSGTGEILVLLSLQ